MIRFCIILVWLINIRVSAQETVLVLPEGHNFVTDFAFYEGGKRGVSLEVGAKSFIWDIERGQLLAKILDSNSLGPVIIRTDEKIILLGQKSKEDTTFLLVFSTDSLKIQHKVELPFCPDYLFRNLLFTFSKSGDSLLLQMAKDSRKMSIDLKKGEIINSSFYQSDWVSDHLTYDFVLQDTFYYKNNRNIYAYNRNDTLLVQYNSKQIKLTNRLIQPVSKLFSPDDKRIFLVYPDFISKLDLTDGRFTPSILPAVSGISLASISLNEKLMAVKTLDKKIQLWDIPNKFKILETVAPAGTYDLKFDKNARTLLMIKWLRDSAEHRVVYKIAKLNIQQKKLIDNNEEIYIKPEFELVTNLVGNQEEEARAVFTEAQESFYDTVTHNYFNKYSTKDSAACLLSLNISLDGKVGYLSNGSQDLNGLSYNQQNDLRILSEIAFGKQVKYISAGTDIFSLDKNAGIRNYFDADAISNRSKYLFKDYRLFGFSARRELLAIYFIADAGFLIKTPDNYYMSAGTPNKWLGFRKNKQLISFEQLDVKYNRPDKVLEAMGNTDTVLIKSYRKAYEKRIKKLGIDTTSFQDGYSVPECDFTNRDAIEYEQKNETFSLHIKGVDSVYKLDRFNVWVNESPVFGQRGISIRRRNVNSIDTNITIKLSQGENRIEASITNVNGTESYRMPLIVNYAPEKPERELAYFIGIGISRFADNKYNLNYSVKDVRDLAVKLKEKYGNNIIIDTLFDENVTVFNVKALKQILQKTTVNDKVIVSYSGHGMLSKDFDYYLSTYAVNFDKPEQNGLSYDDLESLLDSIPAKKKLMLIDACHSGEVDKDELTTINSTADSLKLVKGIKPVAYKKERHLGLENSFELMQNLFVNVGKSTGATIISAAAGTQFALERSDLKNGVFTYSIIEAMQKNKTMKVSELKKVVSERVVQLTNGLQKPTSRNETIAVDWEIW